MTEYTTDQNECVEFYYNLKMFQDNMAKYMEALNRSSTAQIKMDIAKSEGNKGATEHWEKLNTDYSEHAKNYLKLSTEAYMKIKN